LPVVLYVEDNPDNFEVTRLHLSRLFRLLWARSDAEACSLIQKHHAELVSILMDIELQGSGLDGIELTRLLRGVPPGRPLPPYAAHLPIVQTPIFFITAYTARYSTEELTRAGGDRVITKPVNFAELSLALSQAQLKEQTSSAKVIQAASGPGATPASLLGHVSEDPEVSARAARILRSKAFDAPDSVATLRDVGICLSVLDLLPDGPPSIEGRDLMLANVFRRAAAAALLAHNLSPATRESAFAIGLLLDAGLLARAVHDPQGALEVARCPALVRTLREEAAGDGGHPTRGAEIAAELQVQDAIRSAILQHHDAEAPRGEIERCAWLAERFAAVFEAGDHRRQYQVALAAAAQLGWAESDAVSLLEKLPLRVSELASALEQDVGPQAPLPELLSRHSPSLSELQDVCETAIHRLAAVVTEKDALAKRLEDARQQLSHQAMTDGLTNLPNRRAFEEAFRREIGKAHRLKLPIGLVLLDLDNFKAINDLHGHPVGDEVLRRLGDILRSNLRANDSPGRYGGEEFGIVSLGADEASLQTLAERLRRTLSESPMVVDGKTLRVTASFGVAWLSATQDVLGDVEDLVHRADGALYAAKESGRNRVVLEGSSASELDAGELPAIDCARDADRLARRADAALYAAKEAGRNYVAVAPESATEWRAGVGILEDDVFGARVTDEQSRKDFRFSMSLPVLHRRSAAGDWAEATTQDVSQSGVRLVLNGTVSVGTTLDLEITLPDKGRTVRAEGTVVWVGAPREQTVQECGIALSKTAPADLFYFIADRVCDAAKQGFAELGCRSASSLDDLRAAYRCVYEEYSARGYCKPNPSGMHYYACCVLPDTRTFMLERNRGLFGTGSIFLDSPYHLPMDEIFAAELDGLRAQGCKLAEIGLLALNAETPGSNKFALTNLQKQTSVFRLFKWMYDYLRRFTETTDIVIMVHPKHQRLYRYFGFEAIGSILSYAGANGNPALPMRHNMVEYREGRVPQNPLYEETPEDVRDDHFAWTTESARAMLFEERPLWQTLSRTKQEILATLYPGLVPRVGPET